ncbi:hypothetical protein [Bdellovibrio sp. HCB288]|uniref:hypothetical protein n=1 Tax=Bdellovibrio sp. HCB288 TaxID=3394355 RepID=UPI0039B45669
MDKSRESQDTNWDAVTSAVHRRWDRISDEELNSLNESAEAVIELLAEKYHISPKDAEGRLHAAVMEEEDRSHSLSEIRAAEMRFESDGGRVVPSYTEFHETHDMNRMRVHPENPH